MLVDALDIHEDGDLILVHIEGSHFIWKMVRRLVGVLVEVGRGGLTADDAAAMLSETVGRAGATDRAGVGTVPRARLLRGRPPRPAGAAAGSSAVIRRADAVLMRADRRACEAVARLLRLPAIRRDQTGARRQIDDVFLDALAREHRESGIVADQLEV